MSLRQWLLLLTACLAGLAGLFLAANAREGTAYGIGLLESLPPSSMASLW